MKAKFITLMFFFQLILSINKVDSQVINFCEGIDNFGNPIGSSSVFKINSDGGFFYFLVRLQEPMGCSYANYKIYKVNYNGSENYSTTIEQTDINPNWRWFWKKVTFYESGTYMVYVEDCNGKNITSGKITVNFK